MSGNPLVEWQLESLRAPGVDQIGLVRGYRAGDLDPARRDKLDVTALLKLLLTSGFPIQTAAVDGGWCEVDSPSDLEFYRARAAESAQGHEAWSHDWRA